MLLATVESAVPKIVVLAGASHLEHEVQKSILDYYSWITGHDQRALAVSGFLSKTPAVTAAPASRSACGTAIVEDRGAPT